MWPIFQKIVDSVFPPSPDECLVRPCTEHTVQQLYQPHIRHDVTILLSYQDPTVRALIHLAKFQYHQRAHRLLASILQHHLAEATTTPYWLVPIPLSRRRWRERGYNQVYEVAKRVRLPTNHHLLETKLLSRTRHTRPQTDLNRADRLQNVTNAFSCRTDAAPPALIILDDVCTTGSTLKAAQTTCKQAYPQVPIIKLALAG